MTCSGGLMASYARAKTSLFPLGRIEVQAVEQKLEHPFGVRASIVSRGNGKVADGSQRIIRSDVGANRTGITGSLLQFR